MFSRRYSISHVVFVLIILVPAVVIVAGVIWYALTAVPDLPGPQSAREKPPQGPVKSRRLLY